MRRLYQEASPAFQKTRGDATLQPDSPTMKNPDPKADPSASMQAGETQQVDLVDLAEIDLSAESPRVSRVTDFGFHVIMRME